MQAESENYDNHTIDYSDATTFLAPTIRRTSQLQKALTKQISQTSIVHCNSERTLNELNRERNSLMLVRDHVESLLNMLLEIRRLEAGDLVSKECCLKQLDVHRRNLLEAGQGALLEMQVNTGAHDAIAQVIGFVDGSIMPESPPESPGLRSRKRWARRASLGADFKLSRGDPSLISELSKNDLLRRCSTGPALDGVPSRASVQAHQKPSRYSLPLPNTNTSTSPTPPFFMQEKSSGDQDEATSCGSSLMMSSSVESVPAAMLARQSSTCGVDGGSVQGQRAPLQPHPAHHPRRLHEYNSCQSLKNQDTIISEGTLKEPKGGHSSDNSRERGQGRSGPGALAWLGRTVIAGGFLLWWLQGHIFSSGARLRRRAQREGGVVLPIVLECSDMEEIVVYPPVGRRRRRPRLRDTD